MNGEKKKGGIKTQVAVAVRIRKKWDALGVFLVEKLRLDRPGKGTQGLARELEALEGGSRTAIRQYYVRKLQLVLAVFAAGVLLTGVCFLVFQGRSGSQTLLTLLRPGYGEDDRKEELSVQVDGEEARAYTVVVDARAYTDDEEQEFLDLAIAELDGIVQGENESLDDVRAALYFPTTLADGVVEVGWTTSPYGVIAEDGSIKAALDEEGTLVEITARLSCGDLTETYTIYANVYPVEMTEEEALLAAIEAEVAQANEDTSTDEELVLPTQAYGKVLSWQRHTKNPYLSVLALTLVLSLCLYIEMDQEVHKRAEARRNQLLLDYPELMWKMTMLLGAGMSIRGVFFRISEEYTREKNREQAKGDRRKMKKRYVYEEVSYACHEMQSGIGEAQAYERFGHRCQLPEYIRIGSILAQNLRKGSKGLTALLQKEAESSLNDRKQRARKIGEQAGTKLLLPMVLMLGIVLVVLMVPAFLSF